MTIQVSVTHPKGLAITSPCEYDVKFSHICDDPSGVPLFQCKTRANAFEEFIKDADRIVRIPGQFPASIIKTSFRPGVRAQRAAYMQRTLQFLLNHPRCFDVFPCKQFPFKLGMYKTIAKKVSSDTPQLGVPAPMSQQGFALCGTPAAAATDVPQGAAPEAYCAPSDDMCTFVLAEAYIPVAPPLPPALRALHGFDEPTPHPCEDPQSHEEALIHPAGAATHADFDPVIKPSLGDAGRCAPGACTGSCADARCSNGDKLGASQRTLIEHVVKPGDSIVSLAVLYRSSVPAIRRVNRLVVDDLACYPRSILLIPNGVPVTMSEVERIRYDTAREIDKLTIAARLLVDAARMIGASVSLEEARFYVTEAEGDVRVAREQLMANLAWEAEDAKRTARCR